MELHDHAPTPVEIVAVIVHNRLSTRVAAIASEDGDSAAHDLILLGWRFRRRARCGDSAAMAMVLRRRADRRARGRQRDRGMPWADRHGCGRTPPRRAQRS